MQRVLRTPAVQELPGGSFYGTLTDSERVWLRAGGVLRQYRAGYLLTMEGDSSSDVVILLSGWAKATFVTASGEEVVLRIHGPGDVLNADRALTDQPRTETVVAPASCTALTNCTALLVPPRRFDDALAASPGICRAFSRAMLHRAQVADEQVKLRNASPARRLARVLLELADRASTGEADDISLPVDLTQDDLASMLGTSRSTIARTLRSLRGSGVIHTSYRAITITDVRTLRRLAD